MKLYKRLAILSMLIVAQSAPALAQNDINDHSNEYIVSRYYQNPVYGFSISIPSGLKGYGDVPPRPNHGICIPLGDNRTICLIAEFDALQYGSASNAVKAEIENSNGSYVTITSGKLGKVPASEASYTSNGFVQKLREVYLIDDSPILYIARLQTDATHETGDTKVFDQVTASFRKTKCQ